MNYVTETITPEKAKQYLQTSKGNRPMSKKAIRLYADEMKRGKWCLNGVSIIFDSDGHLIDGHHRMEAVIESGIPVPFSVCRGANPDAFSTYDCGRKRNFGQILAIEGVKHYNNVASIIVANKRLEKNKRLYGNNAQQGHELTSNSNYFDIYMSDKEGYDAVAALFVHLIGRCRILSVSWGGGIYYYLTHSGGYSDDEVRPFFDALYSLETSSIHVCNLLRKIITKSAMDGRKLHESYLWNLIAKAWNFYISGVEPKLLRYNHEQEGTIELKIKQQ